MRTLASLTGLLKTNKTGPLFKVLTVLFILIQIPLAHAQSAAFDYVTLAELNQQANLTWKQVVQQKGPTQASQSLVEIPSPEIVALGQQVRQYLMSSQAQFESLTQISDFATIEKEMGAKMHPLLRVLLVNSVMLDLYKVVKETKPGFFSPGSHRANIMKLYDTAFPWHGQFDRIQASDGEKLGLTDLMILARTSALGVYLLRVSKLECSQVIDLSWGFQVAKQIYETSVGFSENVLLAKALGGVYGDSGYCSAKLIASKVESIKSDRDRYNFMKSGDQERLIQSGGTGVVLSPKQLAQIAAQLFGESL
jgi:hypothetical protein